VLAATTAALAAAQALAFVDRGDPRRPPAARGATLEIVLPEWQWQHRRWPANPACVCGAAVTGRPVTAVP
jgi:hypothetical protein